MTITAASRVAVAPAVAARKHKPSTLNYFGIPLGLAGLAGLAGAWPAAHVELGAPAWPVEVLYALSTVAWLALTSTYVARGWRRIRSFQEERYCQDLWMKII